MEEYINLNNYINDSNIYQIQLDNKELIIKIIGKSKISNEIILCNDVGKNKNLILFSIVYTEEELNYYDNLGKIYNLLKLHEKKKKNILNLSVKINEKLEINKIITDFEIYFISSENNYFKKIDKIITKNNIIEKIVSEYILMSK
jgi:hypothetical protein